MSRYLDNAASGASSAFGFVFGGIVGQAAGAAFVAGFGDAQTLRCKNCRREFCLTREAAQRSRLPLGLQINPQTIGCPYCSTNQPYPNSRYEAAISSASASATPVVQKSKDSIKSAGNAVGNFFSSVGKKLSNGTYYLMRKPLTFPCSFCKHTIVAAPAPPINCSICGTESAEGNQCKKCHAVINRPDQTINCPSCNNNQAVPSSGFLSLIKSTGTTISSGVKNIYMDARKIPWIPCTNCKQRIIVTKRKSCSVGDNNSSSHSSLSSVSNDEIKQDNNNNASNKKEADVEYGEEEWTEVEPPSYQESIIASDAVTVTCNTCGTPVPL